MIEKIIYDYLTEAGLTAGMEIPEGGITPPFVLIERTGGGEDEHIRNAAIAIQSYGSSLYDAASLNSTVVALMGDIISLPEISACNLNSDYNYTDTTKRLYRYQAVFDVVYYD